MRLVDVPQQLDETAQVLWAVAKAPQVVLEPTWCLDVGRDCWRLVSETGRPARTVDQGTLVGAGSALEHAVLALEGRHHRVTVTLLPTTDELAIASIALVGPGPTPDLTVSSPAAPSSDEVRPSDLRRLNLAAEAFGVEVLWSSDLTSARSTAGLQRVAAATLPRPMATLVTHDDSPASQVQAGRALAHVLLRATALGLDAHLDVHALGHREMREELGIDIADWTALGEVSAYTESGRDRLHCFQAELRAPALAAAACPRTPRRSGSRSR